jgi:MFS family permease
VPYRRPVPGAEQRLRLRHHSGFRRFWAASTISGLGSYVTTVAVGVLVVVDLGGSPADVGWVGAARWAPYLALGLVAGVLTDRVRRKPLLVVTDLGRAVVLAAVPALAVTGGLSVGSLAALLVVFGLLAVVGDAAHQSFLPGLLPRDWLHRANTRLEQSAASAQTTGPVLAGALVGWLGAPVAVLVDAASFAVSGVLVARTPVDDRRLQPAAAGLRAIPGELREGLSWVYRHRTLRPLAVSTHVWFVFNAVLGTVYLPFALQVLDLGAVGLGISLAGAGVGALLGSSLSSRLLRWLEVPSTVTAARLVEAAGFAVVALAPAAAGAGVALAVASLGQLLFGLGLGVENPVELSYRQGVTPDRLQGRMNATMRSLNRAAVVVGAPLGGVLATATSPRTALVAGAVGMAVSAAALRVTGFCTATAADAAPGHGAGGTTSPSSSAPAR